MGIKGAKPAPAPFLPEGLQYRTSIYSKGVLAVNNMVIFKQKYFTFWKLDSSAATALLLELTLGFPSARPLIPCSCLFLNTRYVPDLHLDPSMACFFPAFLYVIDNKAVITQIRSNCTCSAHLKSMLAVPDHFHFGHLVIRIIIGDALFLILSPLCCHSMGSPDPELPDTTLFLIVLFRNFQADISALWE